MLTASLLPSRWASVITRFAPSPTGKMHLGGIRTALFNYLFTQQNDTNSKFILRIEDTDQTRFKPHAYETLIEALDWAHIIPDKSPATTPDDPLGPFFQSQRLGIYSIFAHSLVKQDKAYLCFCSQERLTKVRENSKSKGLATSYDQYCSLNLTASQIQENIKNNIPYTIRLKVNHSLKNIAFNDVVHKRVSVEPQQIDDQILLKTDGFPTYHLANVIDDYLMGVTHVIRGEEWLSSTPKHVLLYHAFNWPLPQFIHVPLLLNHDKSKVSKRNLENTPKTQWPLFYRDPIQESLNKKHSPINLPPFLQSARQAGFIPAGLVNGLVLLGWNPGTVQEIFSMKQLVDSFSLSRINKSNAILDWEKMLWINGNHLAETPVENLYPYFLDYLDSLKTVEISSEYSTALKLVHIPSSRPSLDQFCKMVGLVQDRLKSFEDLIVPRFSFLFEDPQPQMYSQQFPLFQKKNKTDIEKLIPCLELCIKDLSCTKTFNTDEFGKILEKNSPTGKKSGLLYPMRFVLTGTHSGHDLGQIFTVLGVKTSIQRISNGIDFFSHLDG